MRCGWCSRKFQHFTTPLGLRPPCCCGCWLSQYFVIWTTCDEYCEGQTKYGRSVSWMMSSVSASQRGFCGDSII